MNPIDDMFRDGLDGRKAEVPADMWSRVSAGKAAFTPEGKGVDQYFSDALKDRSGDVPSDMWNRITGAGIPAAASLDQVFADGLKDRAARVPAGMWDRIWKARTAAPFFSSGRFIAAVAAVLLLLSLGWWLVEGNNKTQASSTTVPAEASVDNNVDGNSGSIAGAIKVEGAGQKEFASSEEIMVIEAETTSEIEMENAPPINTNLAASSKPATEERVSPVISGERPTLDATEGTESTSVQPVNISEPTTTAANSLRQASMTMPSLNSTQVITSLAVRSPELKVKKGFKLKTPSVNRFRAANRHRLQTEFLFGAFYANQQFSAETDAQRGQRNLREVRENPGLSYQVSLRGAYRLNEKLLLRSGLTYSEIRNKFEFEDVINGRDVLLTTNNHIRQLEVPVLLGLRIPGRRLNVSLNAGPLVNLTTSVQGRFLHPDSVEPLSLAADGQYRRNVGVGFMTSLSTTYVIGKKQPFVLLVEPFFKTYPSSFTMKDAPLKETYWAAGLQLGVRKGF